MKSSKLIALLINVVILGIATVLLFNGNQEGLVFGLIIFGGIINFLVELRITGLEVESDERSKWLLLKGNDFAHRMTYCGIIVLLLIHFFFVNLQTGFVLILLLVILFLSEALGTLFYYYKK
ncbi:hypothetical protein ACFFIS_09820 [Virgibacillus soli]|uniref:Uncharacterized protein n=1 Tax=Paracerasibacillus soli TaxID=480284 RepID=A0ABU5CM35_9BACI|nr:hypothetical protein [Virgibacillus soli]MDY0407428.1 hypothetical protein [Virgibacillus soli]